MHSFVTWRLRPKRPVASTKKSSVTWRLALVCPCALALVVLAWLNAWRVYPLVSYTTVHRNMWPNLKCCFNPCKKFLSPCRWATRYLPNSLTSFKKHKNFRECHIPDRKEYHPTPIQTSSDFVFKAKPTFLEYLDQVITILCNEITNVRGDEYRTA